MMGGSAYTGPNSKHDIFLQKLNADYELIWTQYYGWEDSDEFADALLTTDHVYIAGSSGVLVPGTTYYRDQIYVVKADTAGVVDWEVTYGGA